MSKREEWWNPVLFWNAEESSSATQVMAASIPLRQLHHYKHLLRKEASGEFVPTITSNLAMLGLSAGCTW